jgi:hypothetical protein
MDLGQQRQSLLGAAEVHQRPGPLEPPEGGVVVAHSFLFFFR